jgi:hypothetical protein
LQTINLVNPVLRGTGLNYGDYAANIEASGIMVEAKSP